MGLSLNHVAEGAVGWFGSVDSNWDTLESSYVARLQSDASVVTVTSTTSETLLMDNTTVPANALGVGTVIRCFAAGTVDPAGVSGTVTFRLRWGGISGTVLTTAAFSVSGSTVRGWVADARIFGKTTGSSGTLELERSFFIAGANTRGIVASTIDTTADKDLVWTIEPGSTSHVITQRLMVTELG